MQTWSYNQFERFQKDITIIRSTGNIKLIRILTENIFQKKKKKKGKEKKSKEKMKILKEIRSYFLHDLLSFCICKSVGP